MKADAWSLVFTGLSLTCITAAVLFVLVAINPKEAAYGQTPLVYAGGSAVLAIAFNRAAARLSRLSVPEQTDGKHRQQSSESGT